MSNEVERLRRAAETCVYAPIGVALWLRDLAPNFVNIFVARGRAEVQRREEQVQVRIQSMRSAVDVAAAFGVPALRDQVIGRGSRTPAAPGDTAAAPNDALLLGGDASPPAAAAPPVAQSAGDERGARPVNGALAIPGYDALSASQVVERLTGLDAGELRAVREYEARHRQRRTILGKIDQLAAG